MAIPYTQIRMYMPEGTFSVDFYLEPEDERYLEKFLANFENARKAMQGKAAFRATPFYFTRCSNCQCTILTNRDRGYRIVCQRCKHEGTTSPLADPRLKPLLDGVEAAIAKLR